MQIAYSLEKISKSLSPVILTIGSFDGVHLGHQAVLKHLAQTAKEKKTTSAVLTFSNHPSTVLRPHHPTPLLCTKEHKVLLLDQASIDLSIILPFTKELSEQSAEQFLQRVREFLPFQTLILGSDAHIGKNREGDRSTVTALSTTLGFSLEYYPDHKKDGERISSRRIREYIQQGELKQAKALLGRAYSIFGAVLKGNGRGAPLGFPTANININNLCLPPLGVYAVTLFENGTAFQGVANLGFAPTIRPEGFPILEVHLFDAHIDLYGKMVDVYLHDFIRSEMKFENIEDLRNQISQDVIKAKQIHQANGI